jgi:DNA-3-methyladenine glycosylase II
VRAVKHLDTMEFEQLPLVADLPVPMGPAAPLPVAPLGAAAIAQPAGTTAKQAVAPKAAAPKIHLDLPDGVPAYWAEACRQLMRRDRVLKRLIPQLGSQALLPCGQEQAFATLARSIVGQQISAKSAKTLWNKFAKLPAAARAGAQAQGGRYAWRGTVGAQGGLSGRSGAALHRASPAHG